MRNLWWHVKLIRTIIAKTNILTYIFILFEQTDEYKLSVWKQIFKYYTVLLLIEQDFFTFFSTLKLVLK